VIRPALVFGQWLTGTEFRHTSLVGNLPELPVPAMLVLPSQDTFLTPKGRQELEHAFSRHLSKHPTATMLACSAPHLMTANLEPEQYHRTLQRFLSLAGRPNLVSC
jgi:hypothetical protein